MEGYSTRLPSYSSSPLSRTSSLSFPSTLGSRPTTPNSSDRESSPDYVNFSPSQDGSSSRNGQFILVIGGLGYIGSHTTLELVKNGLNVIIVDNLSNSYIETLDRIRHLAELHHKTLDCAMPIIHFHKLDYRTCSMRYLLDTYSETSFSPGSGSHRAVTSRISGVIHFAAYKAVSESIEKPILYYKNNLCGLVDLVSLLGKYEIWNLVFSSSATVYGSNNQGKSLREEDLVHRPEEWTDEEGIARISEPQISGLTSPYGRTKYFGEAILADVAASDSRWQITALRYFNPVGSEQSGLLGEDPRTQPTNLFPVMTQVLLGLRSELQIFGNDWETRDGTPIRDYVHVTDIALGHVAAISVKHKKHSFRAYNLGSGIGTTVLEAVKALEEASGKQIALKFVGKRPGDIASCVASNERARKEIGWFPTQTITQCALDCWNFVGNTLARA